MTDISIITEILNRAPEAIGVAAVIAVVILFLRHMRESQKNFQTQIERVGDNFSNLVRSTQEQMKEITTRCHDHEAVFLREVERIVRER